MHRFTGSWVLAALALLAGGACDVPAGARTSGHAVEAVSGSPYLLALKTAGGESAVVAAFAAFSMSKMPGPLPGSVDEKIPRKKPGRTTYANIVLERGFTATEELWAWRKAIEAGLVDRRSGSVIILDENGEEADRVDFAGGLPVHLVVEPGGFGAVVRIEIAIVSSPDGDTGEDGDGGG